MATVLSIFDSNYELDYFEYSAYSDLFDINDFVVNDLSPHSKILCRYLCFTFLIYDNNNYQNWEDLIIEKFKMKNNDNNLLDEIIKTLKLYHIADLYFDDITTDDNIKLYVFYKEELDLKNIELPENLRFIDPFDANDEIGILVFNGNDLYKFLNEKLNNEELSKNLADILNTINFR